MNTLTIADQADLFALEHRLPLGWMVVTAFAAANVASTVLMLLAQG
jgi:hypothetical protein